jgi:hypothetical protein
LVFTPIFYSLIMRLAGKKPPAKKPDERPKANHTLN